VLRSVLCVCFAIAASLVEGGEAPAPDKRDLSPGTYARLETASGEILVRLLPDAAPKTVANFVELAKGERPFKDTKGRWVTRPYFDGLTFHRVEKDELIQGGCPKGDGTGGPGYQFDNETNENLKFDKPGRVAMANAGRDTNGSQFFITLKASPSYDGSYTVFGEVVAGLDVVKTISAVPATARRGLHLAKEPVAIQSVTIEQVTAPEEAK
jgi:peptidyl-prolyl cis-trans isomerase A (cyclophilin A)